MQKGVHPLIPGTQRPGYTAALGKVLGVVAGVRPGHPTKPSAGRIYDRMSDGVRLEEVERVVF